MFNSTLFRVFQLEWNTRQMHLFSSFFTFSSACPKGIRLKVTVLKVETASSTPAVLSTELKRNYVDKTTFVESGMLWGWKLEWMENSIFSSVAHCVKPSLQFNCIWEVCVSCVYCGEHPCRPPLSTLLDHLCMFCFLLTSSCPPGFCIAPSPCPDSLDRVWESLMWWPAVGPAPSALSAWTHIPVPPVTSSLPSSPSSDVSEWWLDCVVQRWAASLDSLSSLSLCTAPSSALSSPAEAVSPAHAHSPKPPLADPGH